MPTKAIFLNYSHHVHTSQTGRLHGTCAHDSSTKFGLTYSYGTAGSNNGLIASITDSVDNGRSATYAYDALYRLSTAVTPGSTNYPAWGLQENYDRYGNRLSQAAISGCTGQTCPQPSVLVDVTTNRITGSPYAFDANGNMTNDGINTLTYDAENHAVSSSGVPGSGAYTFDGNGRRVKKGSGSTTTVYVFSGSKVIAEYDNGAGVTSPSREYVYGGSALLAKIDSSGTKYYHQDHLSNRLVTSSSGATVEQMGHFPFGESWYNATNDKLVFTSYERDAESGNDYAMARIYVNRLGRFSSPDRHSGSTVEPQSLNRYSYVQNNPIGLVDPTGMDAICDELGEGCDSGGGGGGGDGGAGGGGGNGGQAPDGPPDIGPAPSPPPPIDLPPESPLPPGCSNANCVLVSATPGSFDPQPWFPQFQSPTISSLFPRVALGL